MEKERTLILLKPDSLIRCLSGRILQRFEEVGLKIIGMKMIWAQAQTLEEHYPQKIAERHGERVRNTLMNYLKEGPIVAIVLEGVDAIAVARKITGSTYPNESLPGTIRGDFAHASKDFVNSKEINLRNLIHASEDKEDSDREIPLWFTPEELHSYTTVHDIICFEEKL